MLLNTVTKQSENQEVNSYSLLLARWGAAKINKTSNMEKNNFFYKIEHWPGREASACNKIDQPFSLNSRAMSTLYGGHHVDMKNTPA